MAIRSAISMLVPMLEHQARQFSEEGVHGGLLDDNRALYEAIELRLNEHRKTAVGGGSGAGAVNKK